MDFPHSELTKQLTKLITALHRGRSEKWCLKLWSQYIKARDGHQCLACRSARQVQAHHIFRRTMYPLGRFQPGNGITLCNDCHRKQHATFNGKPSPQQPFNFQGGDDFDDMAFYLQCLMNSALSKGLDLDSFYFIDDHMLQFIVRIQGYQHLYVAVQRGKLSRLQMACEAMRTMPESLHLQLIKANWP